MVKFKPIDKQIKELNIFLKDNSVLIFATFIITFLTNFKPIEVVSDWDRILFGTSYLITIFLLVILCKQLSIYMNSIDEKKEISLWNEIKQFNHLLYILFILLLVFTSAILLAYVNRFPKEIGFTTGFVFGIWIAIPLLLICIGLPLSILLYISKKAKREKEIKDKILLYGLSFTLFGICVPLISYFCKIKFEDLLIIPIIILTFIGWVLFIVGILDIYHTLKNKKKK